MGTDTFATTQRLSVLETLEFCQKCAEGMLYRPTYHRADPALVAYASEYLHQLMHYTDDQPEY